MQHDHRPALRRTAAFGATIAIVSAASAFGLGATGASAAGVAPAPVPADTSSASNPTTNTSATGTDGSAPTPMTTPTPAPPSSSGDQAATTTPPTPAATEAATPDQAAPNQAAPNQAAPDATAPNSPAPDATTEDAAATPAGTVTVSGTPRAWRTLTADTSGWPAGTTFTYAWHFQHPVVIDSLPAMDRTYIVDPELQDATVTVTVTGTAPGADPVTVTSAPTAPVVVEDQDRQFLYGDRVVPVPVDEPFSMSLAPAPNPDLRFFANGSIVGGPDASALPAGVTLSEDGVLSGTLHRSPSEGFWVHVSTPFHPAGGLSERILLSAVPNSGGGNGAGEGTGPGEGTDAAGSSPQAPIRLEATAGVPFSHDLSVDADRGEDVRYALRSENPEYSADPLESSTYRFDERTGVLSGTDTQAQWLSFAVDATVGGRTTTRYVELTVLPGATTGLQLWLTLVDDPQHLQWGVDQDGTVTRSVFPQGPAVSTTVPRPSVPQSSALDVRATPVDRWGNPTAPVEDVEGDGSVLRADVRSDVATDVVTPGGAAVRVRFPHASTHTLTISRDGQTAVVPIEVVPRGGQLAFTGADPAGPLAAAGSLLAAGAALLVRGIRRRRA